MILSFQTDMTCLGSVDTDQKAPSLICVYTVCHFVWMFWLPYSMVKSRCLNFRIITTFLGGIQAFSIFTVVDQLGKGCLIISNIFEPRLKKPHLRYVCNQIRLKIGLLNCADGISSQSLNFGGRRGTTDDIARIPFHPSLSSAALRESPNPIPIHSLMLSSHLFFCLPLLLAPFTVSYRIVLAIWRW